MNTNDKWTLVPGLIFVGAVLIIVAKIVLEIWGII